MKTTDFGIKQNQNREFNRGGIKMNFDELREKFVTMGEKALKTLATQMKEVMTGEAYEKFVAFCERQQKKSDQAMSFGKEIIGELIK